MYVCTCAMSMSLFTCFIGEQACGNDVSVYVSMCAVCVSLFLCARLSVHLCMPMCVCVHQGMSVSVLVHAYVHGTASR